MAPMLVPPRAHKPMAIRHSCLHYTPASFGGRSPDLPFFSFFSQLGLHIVHDLLLPVKEKYPEVKWRPFVVSSRVRLDPPCQGGGGERQALTLRSWPLFSACLWLPS